MCSHTAAAASLPRAGAWHSEPCSQTPQAPWAARPVAVSWDCSWQDAAGEQREMLPKMCEKA